MKRLSIILLVIILGVFSGVGLFIFTRNKNNTVDIEKNIASSLANIEVSNKKYLETKEEEDATWEVILETMEIESKDTWDNLLEVTETSDVDIAEALKNMPIVGVGDSVFLSAINDLKKIFPNGYFDGKVSRSLSGGIPILKQLKQEGRLTDYVVLGLATNGDFREDKCIELMSILEDRNVYWISAVGADDPKFNQKFTEFAKNYPNIRIIRWDQAAANHPEYFYKDGIHTKQPGVDAYVKVVSETIYKDNLKLNINSKQEMLKQHEEEISKRIAFYGNDLLINSYSLISQSYDNAIFNVKRNYKFEELYKDIESKVTDGTLEYKVVFMFDSTNKLTKEDYEKLIKLCEGHKVYIVNTFLDRLSLSDGVNVIDLYDDFKNSNGYYLNDKIHLTKDGNQYLVTTLVNTLK